MRKWRRVAHVGAARGRLVWWHKALVAGGGVLLVGAWGAAFASPAQTPVAQPTSYSYDAPAPEVPVEDLSQPTAKAVPAPAEQADIDPLAARTVPASDHPSDIPGPALAAYKRAEGVLALSDPGCKISWELIAAIGKVESDHGRYGGSTVAADGQTTRPIRGLPLNGANQTARISDTDDGAWDGDARWDRAVGPMQFIPSTWRSVAVDGNNDGKKDPNNIVDAAVGAAVYLCVGDRDLSTDAGARAAVFSYNHSSAYVGQVMALARAYATGTYTAPPLAAPSGSTTPLPPISPFSGSPGSGAPGAGAPGAGAPSTGGSPSGNPTTSTQQVKAQSATTASPSSKPSKPKGDAKPVTSPKADKPTTKPTKPTKPTGPSAKARAQAYCGGTVTSTWFTATQIGTYTSTCVSSYTKAFNTSGSAAKAQAAASAVVSSAKSTLGSDLAAGGLAPIEGYTDADAFAGHVADVVAVYTADGRAAAKARIQQIVADNPEPEEVEPEGDDETAPPKDDADEDEKSESAKPTAAPTAKSTDDAK